MLEMLESKLPAIVAVRPGDTMESVLGRASVGLAEEYDIFWFKRTGKGRKRIMEAIDLDPAARKRDPIPCAATHAVVTGTIEAKF